MTVKHIGASTFINHLLADQYGRIADDPVTKKQRADDWAADFMEVVREITVPVVDMNDGTPTMYVPIGPSGCGKSTYYKTFLEDSDINVFSLDRLRHEFYHPTDYRLAYEGSVNDKSFEARSKARFHYMVKERKSMYLDNTNLSAKRRKFYLDVARKHGFKTIAVVMPVSLSTVLKRQQTRSDKCVPDSAVISQYNSLQLPLYGEFDGIHISAHNLFKGKSLAP
jgi:predicted kinase